MNKNLLTDYDRVVTIAVDVQNDFCPGGSLAVGEGDKVVDPLNRVMAYTRKIGGTVIATCDWHPEQTPHWEKWPVHCVAGTEGAAFHPDLDIQPNDIIVRKGTGQTDGYSGFEGKADDGATIAEIIRPRKKGERIAVVMGGLATDYCVLNTLLDAAKQAGDTWEADEGFIHLFALTDAMRAVNINETDEERALTQMRQSAANLVTSDELLAA